MTKKTRPPSPFAAALSAFRARREEDESEFAAPDVPADGVMLDRLGSLSLAVAERLAPAASSTSASPETVAAFLGATKEARSCVLARREIEKKTDEGNEDGAGVRVVIEHKNTPMNDDLDVVLRRDADVALPPRPATS